jgi:hypothetical protein
MIDSESKKHHIRCKHPYDSLIKIETTCGYVNATLIECQKCGQIIYGTFTCHSDNHIIPDE